MTRTEIRILTALGPDEMSAIRIFSKAGFWFARWNVLLNMEQQDFVQSRWAHNGYPRVRMYSATPRGRKILGWKAKT